MEEHRQGSSLSKVVNNDFGRTEMRPPPPPPETKTGLGTYLRTRLLFKGALYRGLTEGGLHYYNARYY
jgi:hypothetical protein